MTTPTDIERLKALTIAIQSYQQADEEGVMVLVSRQACDETAAALRALPSLLARIERVEGEPSAISLLERARDELVECAQDYHHQPKAMIAEINAYLAAAEQSLSSARAEGWKAGRDAAAKVARERSFDLRCANSGAEVMPGSCDEGDAIADIIDALEMPK